MKSRSCRLAVVWGFVALSWIGPVAAQQDGAVDERPQKAEELVGQSEKAAGRRFAPAFRAVAVRALGALSAEELRARADRGAGIVPLALGQTNKDLIYTPVTPCRIIDTRLAGGLIAADSTRDFRVAGIALHEQGGHPDGCGVPVGPATAAVINFVAVSATGPGALHARDYATPPLPLPKATILNYTPVPGADLMLANGVVVPLCNSALTLCPFDLRVQAETSSLHLVADVMGYFSRFPAEEVAVPAGTMLDFGGVSAPAGYLPCDGSQVSRTTYAGLFAVIGTAYGAGNGSTTFHLPDFRGRFARGWNGTGGSDPDRNARGASNPGGNVGNAIGSLQGDAFRAHTHSTGWGWNFAGNPFGGPNNDLSHSVTNAPRSTGTAGGNETRPLNVYVNRIVKY